MIYNFCFLEIKIILRLLQQKLLLNILLNFIIQLFFPKEFIYLIIFLNIFLANVFHFICPFKNKTWQHIRQESSTFVCDAYAAAVAAVATAAAVGG